jgi:nucleoside-diphosphate-sugar epimerase
MMARQYGMTVAALRYPFVGGFGDRLTTMAQSLRADPAPGANFLWAYLEDRDAATVAWLALTVPLTGYQLFTVAAPDILHHRDTEDLLDEYLPGVPRRRPLPGRSTPWDITAATEQLGFQPVHLYVPDRPDQTAAGATT